MNEHDDDLESEITEGSEEEREIFPSTAEDVDEASERDASEADEDEDQDPSEL